MRTFVTILVCDRCQKRREYEHEPGHVHCGCPLDAETAIRDVGWTWWWPSRVTPFGYSGGEHQPQTVCLDCLTSDELGQVTRYQPDEYPPGF